MPRGTGDLIELPNNRLVSDSVDRVYDAILAEQKAEREGKPTNPRKGSNK